MAKTLVQNPATAQLRTRLTALVTWRQDHLIGDEKGEAQSFLDRLFRAFGHAGVQEAGAQFESRIRKGPGSRGVSFADLMWKPRVIVEMKRSGTPLARHYQQAFDYWTRSVPERPRYVLLCNFDEFWIYDFETQLDEPIDRVKLIDLPQRWEALAFLLPRELKPVFGNDLVDVTRTAAAKVAAVFRAMTQRDVPREIAQRFILQCVMAMFAEDTGLLPRHSFTEALRDAKDGADAYDLIGGLFREMNTPGITAGGRFAGTPHFNGGLFAHISPQELSRSEVDLLRDACRENWGSVRPEIFGTIFEQSLDANERHALGAHFTSQVDIMRVVGPCIVEPWRERIAAATTQKALSGLLHDLSQYRVLDPACGSGNFLYVAYRALRRIEHEITGRLAEMSGRPDQGSFAYVQPENFYGIDINPLAVEIAKVTMMLGKKLSADEFGDSGGVLPLDNLDSSIVTADALFSPWPRADVIIGNPPYIGNRKMTTDLGADYVGRLHEAFGPKGVADFVTYWFPKAHDHLPDGARAGFVATKSIHQGDGRKASLDYVVARDGVIIEAAKMIPWSGDAQVTVDIVNWQKGGIPPATRVLWTQGATLREEVAEISAGLDAATDMTATLVLQANKDSFYQGQTYGIAPAFKITAEKARTILRSEKAAAEVIHPVLGGDELLKTIEVRDWVIDVPCDDSDEAYRNYPSVMKSLEQTAMPRRVARGREQAADNERILARNPDARVNVHHIRFADRWWRLGYRREEMLEALDGLERYIALTRTSSEKRGPVFTFVSKGIRVSDGAVAFPFDDDYSFGVLQSSLHTRWFEAKCTTLETRLTYTAKTVGAHFPWPQAPTPDKVLAVAKAAEAIVEHRAQPFRMGVTLADQYDVLRKPGKSKLRDLHSALDAAVMDAYGFELGTDVLPQLLALNHSVAAAEAAGQKVTGPGPVPGVASRLSTWAFPLPTL
ncbi:DNA methyltransferase [Sanguibacter massiliensis]|uniref:DNA methyltransferase n=1 Tax=Sanguibacter massiliensis TaxID=1973217 RepID=UPI00101AECDA|nr:DNA methyltransferase [Sanguibacter massiliensis]